MKVNGKSKTPITAAQSKKSSGERSKSSNGKPGGTKARASQQTSKSKNYGVKSAVLERISDGILAFDAGMNYTYLNERAGELLGRSAEDLVGKNLREEYPDMGRTPFMEACQRALETQSVVWLNEYFPPTNRWLEGRIYPSENGISVLFREGTPDNADAERAQMLAMFPEQNPAPVMRLTPEAEVLYANRAAAQLLEVWNRPGTSAASFLKIQELLPQVIRDNEDREIEIENEGRVFLCQLVPIPGAGYVNLYFRDITERKRAEEVLRAIVDQPGAGITRTDRQGRFTFVNQAFCDLLGYSESELANMTIWDITDEEMREKNRRLFERLVSTGEGYQLEKRLIRRNGSAVWVSVGASPVRDTDGRILGSTAVVVDISRRKRAEESLLNNARQSLFLASLSDTIRSIDNSTKIQVESACLLGAHLKASRVAYVEVESDGKFHVLDNYTDGVSDMEGWFSLADFIPPDQVSRLQAGRVVSTPDVDRDPRFTDSQRAALRALSIRAQMIHPFTRGDKMVAALLIQQSQPRSWKEDELSLVQESAERMQAAIERARAEGRLRDSERRFRILSNTVPSIVWTSTPDRRLLYVNDRWYDFTGLPRRKEAPLWTDLKLHPDDAESFFREMRSSPTTQTETVAEVRILRRDGVYRWFQTRSVPTMDENGRVTAWHGVLTDIHERVERESEQRKIIDSTPFMLTRCSRDLRYQFVSRAYAEMIGLKPEEVIGRPIVEILGEEGLKTIRPYVERVLRGERVEYENRVPFVSGRTPYLHATYTPDVDEQGNVIGWFASIIDISERRQMEENLRESERKFNIIFNKLPFTAVLLRPDNNVIMDINEEFEAVFGYSKQEAIGKTAFELGIASSPEDRAHILAELQASVAIRDMELELHTRPRGPRLFLINTDIVKIGGSQYILQTAQDITERKRMEEALRESEQKFSLIYDNLPFAAALSRPEDGAIVDINREFENIFGYSKQEVLGKTSFELGIHPHEEQRAHILSELQAQGSVRNLELELFTRQLGRRIFLTNIDLVNIQGSRYILQTAQDITDRKRTEEALNRSEEKYRRIVETANEGIWEIDKDTRTVFVNTRMAEMLGYTMEEMLGHSAFEFVFPEDQEEGERRLARAKRGTPNRSDEFKYRRKDGSPMWGLATTSPQLDEQGRFLGSIAMIMDITERKQAEEARRSAEYRYHMIGELTPYGVWESDCEGNAIYISPSFLDMIGQTLEEHRQSWQTLLHQEDADPTVEAWRECVRTESNWEREFRIRGRDGKYRVILARGFPVHDSDGKVSSYVGINFDFTERKRAEQELAEFARQQQALYRLAYKLSSAASLEEMYNPALDAILSALQCDRASILLFDSQDVMSFVAWRGLSDAYRRATNGHSPWGRGERNARPICLEDVATVALSESLRATVQAEGIGALAFIPLINRGNLIGKFMVYYDKPHVFEETEVDLAQTIAHQLASHIERKRAEETLRQSEERFARFMLHLPGLAWIKDMQGRYIFANAAAQKVFNASMEELYGKTDWEIFPAETAAQSQRNDDLALREEKGVQVVETLPQGDGVVHHSLVTKFPIPGPDGLPMLIGGTAFDITERIQMEEALRVARAQAENTAYRMTQLQKITAALSQTIAPSEIARMVVEQGTFILGAAGGSIMLLNEETQIIEMIYSTLPQSLARPFLRFPLSLRVPTSDAVRSGQPIWIASREEYLQHYPHLAENIQVWDYEAALVFPMVYQGRILGALSLSFSQPLPFSPEDQEYLLTLARQAAQAIERARVETALRLDAAMMENVPAGIYLVRAGDGTILHTNPQFDSLFGYEPGEIVGKNVAVLNAPNGQSPQEVVDRIVAILKAEGSWQGEVLSIRKDGTEFWCYASITTFEHDTYGTVWVAARQDITERKQVEAALRESEQRYRAIVSQATAGIVRKDESGRLLFVNQAFCDMLGMAEVELKGRRIWELTHPDDVGENKRLYDHLMADGIPFQIEKRLIRKDGSIRWMNASVSPVIDSRGKTHSAVSVYVDITGRKLAEGRLALLTTVNELARELEDPNELMFSVSKVVGEHFEAKRTLFNEIDLENDREIVHRDYCRGVESVAGEHKLSAYSNITTAEMMTGKTVVNRDSKLDPRTAPDYERTYRETGERAYVAVPLMREETWVASLWISDDRPRDWEKEDIDLLQAIAERTWTAAEKLRINAALRESQQRLSLTYEHAAIGIVETSLDGRYIRANEEFCRMLGYEKEEVLNLNIRDITYVEDYQIDIELYRQLISGRIPFYRIEKRYVKKDGGLIWTQLVRSAVRSAGGTALYGIGAVFDVTDRKRAEEELHRLNLELEERVQRRTSELQAAYEFLRESEATSRLILESMPDAIVIIDKEGQIVHANTQVETLFGYSPSEVIGQSVEALIPPRFREKHVQNRDLYGQQPNRRPMGLGQEFFGRRKDESEFPVEVMLAPIDNSTNWDVLVAIRDNTKQRQAQQALRINEEKLRTLFEILPVGISFLDQDGRISDLNSALTEIMGLTRNELLTGSYKARRYIRADGSPMLPSEFASTRARAEQKTIYNVETGIIKENGEVIWTSVNAAPVQVADVAAVVVTIDITERKKNEEALHKHRERLRALSRRLVEVQEEERHAIARELHDRVGQNLAALTLNLNILRNQLSGEVLEKVGTRLNDSVTLVKDILTITRSVMADLRPNVLDDYGLDAALNEYAERFTQRYGIRVITHTPSKSTPRLDPGVEMTLLRIAQEALTNIARHAQASQAIMTLEMDSNAVLMTIEDNGQGILSWQKVNQPGSHGLRIMRERAEAFGGSLKIHSTYRNGTKIEVKIPFANSLPVNGSKEKKS